MGGRSRSGRVAGALLVVALFSGGLSAEAPAAPAGATLISFTCPGSTCPYTPPTPIEQGAVLNMVARENAERAAPQRDFTYNGQHNTLIPLTLLSPTSTAGLAAQAAAEWGAAHDTDADYAPDPPGYPWGESTISSLAQTGTTARLDGNFMTSFPHADWVLHALPSGKSTVAVGVACGTTGAMVVSEQFYAPTSTLTTINAMETAEMSENSVYAQSGGTVTTVSDGNEKTATAKHVLPTNPIVAGTDHPYATGVDWTCKVPEYEGGSTPTSPLPAPVTTIASSSDGHGYYLANGAGAVDVHGDAQFYGAANALHLDQPVVRMVTVPTGEGYWMVAGDGGIFSFGTAQFYGSMGGKPLDAPVVSMVPTSNGAGYWEVAADGGIFAFGNASFFGSMGGKPLAEPIVGAVATPTGGGYWMVGQDGGVFAFGSAGYVGSLPGSRVSVDDIVGMIPVPGGGGYWLVGADGGVFSFGDAGYAGSLPGLGVHVDNVVGIATPPVGVGYWLAGRTGSVYAIGVPFYGSD